MNDISTKDLILNISVNLGRLGRYAEEENTKRISTFINDTNMYLDELKTRKNLGKFERTYLNFIKIFKELATSDKYDEEWSDKAYTYANILSHRANLV